MPQSHPSFHYATHIFKPIFSLMSSMNSMCMLSHFSRVWLFATAWTVTRQTPLSMGFSRQEYQSGLPCPPPGDLSDSGIEPMSPVASALQVDSLPLSHNRKPIYPHTNKQFLDINLVSGSSTQFWHYPLRDWIKITQVKGSLQVHPLL